MAIKEPPQKALAVNKKDASSSEEPEALEPFGDQIPFADPSWYQSVSTSRLMSIAGLLADAIDRSITPLTSTRPMPPFGPKFASG